MGTSAELVGNVSFAWEVRMKNMVRVRLDTME